MRSQLHRGPGSRATHAFRLERMLKSTLMRDGLMLLPSQALLSASAQSAGKDLLLQKTLGGTQASTAVQVGHL